MEGPEISQMESLGCLPLLWLSNYVHSLREDLKKQIFRLQGEITNNTVRGSVVCQGLRNSEKRQDGRII